MNSDSPLVSALRLRHTPRLRTQTLALAAALVFSAAVAAGCGGAAPASDAGRACADKVARATTTTTPVAGLWNCLTPSLQTALKAAGAVTNGAFDGALSVGVATTYDFIGANADYATYELHISPAYQQQAGGSLAELTVWMRGSLVDNVGIPSPAF